MKNSESSSDTINLDNLIISIESGNNTKSIETLNRCIDENGPDKFAKMINEKKLLVNIVSVNNKEIFDHLLGMIEDKSKIDFNIKDSSGHSILRLACESGHHEIANKLFENGADTSFLNAKRKIVTAIFGGRENLFNEENLSSEIKNLIERMRSPNSSPVPQVSASLVYKKNDIDRG